MWIGMVVLGLVMATSARLEGAETPEAKPTAPPKKAVKLAQANAAKNAESNKGEKEPTREASPVEIELQQLRDLLESQARQLQAQSEQLRQQQQKMQALEEELRRAVNTTAEVKSTAVSLNSKVSDLKASNEALKTTVATEQAEAKKATEEGPTTINFKGINITPGGFIAAETVFRNRATSGDINTPFTGIPFPNNALSKVTENNFSARQSRLTLLVDTKVGSAKVSGYYEGDFLGAGTTSNNRQSNSYVFRQRQLWANLTFDNGFSLAGGQMWSLVTESKKGIANRQEAFPFQIDAQYVVGWAWQRAYAFRVVKSLGDKFAVGFAIEGPQTTIGGRNFPANFFINAPGSSGGLFNAFDPTGYSLNRAPDFLVKATLDPGWGHYEVVGILRNFRNRVYPCGATPGVVPVGCTTATSPAGAFNDSRVGGGIGATARFPVVGKKLDLVAHFQGGDGIGRYSSAQLADVTARPDGSLAPIRTAAWLGMLELHPTPKFDLYAYGGGEYAARTAYTFVIPGNPTATPPVPDKITAVGYGSRLFNNSGCSTEAFPTSNGPSGSGFPATAGGCAGDIRQILEGTIGFWHKFYQGSKGRLQWGVQYSYLTKVGWSGNNNNATGGTPPVLLPAVSPKAVNNMVFTSFRYYLP
jgi:hypothetical protein